MRCVLWFDVTCVCWPQPGYFDQTPIAVNDVSWLDQDSEDERDGPIRIKEVVPAKRQPVPRAALGQVDFDVNFEVQFILNPF
jgi:hypothetical protein